MIDRDEFSTWMGVLADRFGRALKPPTIRAYYAVLSAELTTEQFVAAAAITLRDATFWPSPKEIVERAKPVAAPALTAAEAWVKVHDIAAGISKFGRSSSEKAQLIAELGPAALRAFHAVGGQRAWTDLLEADVKWLKKEFCDRYADADSHESRIADAGKLAEVTRPRVGGGLTAIGAPPMARIAGGQR